MSATELEFMIEKKMEGGGKKFLCSLCCDTFPRRNSIERHYSSDNDHIFLLKKNIDVEEYERFIGQMLICVCTACSKYIRPIVNHVETDSETPVWQWRELDTEIIRLCLLEHFFRHKWKPRLHHFQQFKDELKERDMWSEKLADYSLNYIISNANTIDLQQTAKEPKPCPGCLQFVTYLIKSEMVDYRLYEEFLGKSRAFTKRRELLKRN